MSSDFIVKAHYPIPYLGIAFIGNLTNMFEGVNIYGRTIARTNILNTHSCDRTKMSNFVTIWICRLLVQSVVCDGFLAMWVM